MTAEMDSAQMSVSGLRHMMSGPLRPVVLAFAASIALFLFGELRNPGFASVSGIESILIVASFTGFVVAGQTLVVLIGGIDLSVPWVLNAGAIMMTTQALGQDSRAAWALLLTLGLGLLVGMVNGIGIAYFAVPAVVMTLGANGIMEGLTLGFSEGMTCVTCSSYAPDSVQSVVRGDLFGVSGDLLLWLAVVVAMTALLGVTAFGRRVYALGNSAEASYLAGINVKRLTVVLYMLSGMFATLAGVVLVGYSGQPTLGMGDPFLFQSIAAVVVGGVSILGGRGHVLGPVVGAITLTTLLSVLRAEHMPEWGRSVLYGVIILGILLIYGRDRRSD
jgi:ribose transport system permease protein